MSKLFDSSSAQRSTEDDTTGSDTKQTSRFEREDNEVASLYDRTTSPATSGARKEAQILIRPTEAPTASFLPPLSLVESPLSPGLDADKALPTAKSLVSAMLTRDNAGKVTAGYSQLEQTATEQKSKPQSTAELTLTRAGEAPAGSQNDKKEQKERPGIITVPEDLKAGAAWNAWDRVTGKEGPDFAYKIRAITDQLIAKSEKITALRTDQNSTIKKDEKGRVVSLENPTKNLKLYFNYDGDSKTVTEFVMQNTKTNEKRTFVSMYRPVTESPTGKQEWLSVDSKGKASHLVGDVSPGDAGGYKINLKQRGETRDLIKPVAETVIAKSPLTLEKENLQKTAERVITKPAERAQYIKDLEQFQTTAKARGLPEKEIADFFKESARLLESKENKFVKLEDRIKLAQQALKQATEPTSIRQGPWNTCNVTSIEVCMNSRAPSKVMKAVTDAALTGKFTTTDGVDITLLPSTLTPKANSRTFASQIFQDIAINTHWKTATAGPGGTTFKPGEIRYDHAGGKAADPDGSQRLTGIDKATGKVTELAKSPWLGAEDYPEIYRKIAGTRPDVVSMHQSKFKSDVPGMESVNSQEKLHERLSELSKKPGGLPIILVVHTSNEPFWKDSGEGKAGGSGKKLEEAKKDRKPPGGWHVVTIHGYDEKTKTAAVDNTWDPASDHLGKVGGGAKIPVEDLFKAMQLNKDRLKELGWEAPKPAQRSPAGRR